MNEEKEADFHVRIVLYKMDYICNEKNVFSHPHKLFILCLLFYFVLSIL